VSLLEPPKLVCMDFFFHHKKKLCRKGEKEPRFLVKVPEGVQQLRMETDAKNVARIAASHGNWQSSDSLHKYEFEVCYLS
jgi:hypothetical protein